jgi:uridine kinase
MKQTIHVGVSGREEGVDIPAGTTILQLKKRIGIGDEPGPVVGALLNGRVMGLEYPVSRDCSVEFITTARELGADIYRRSLSLLLHAAFAEIAEEGAILKIEHSLGRGFFYSYINRSALDRETVSRLRGRMTALVEKRLPFVKEELEIEHALDIFESSGEWDKYYLLKYLRVAKTVLYRLGSCYNLAQGPLVPHTGYLTLFSLTHYPPGLVLSFPHPDNPGVVPEMVEQKKLFQIYSEQREWSRLLDVDSAGKLNRAIIKGSVSNLIWLSEGLHEKKIASIADSITKKVSHNRVVFLAGPSSSGKTTFAKRLTIQLMANGISPLVLSLDDYYLPRERMPKNERGETDFDSLSALDLDLITRHITRLVRGERVEVPIYDFKTGLRERETRPLQMGGDQVLIFEGIHCMNPELTGAVCDVDYTRIYISALTQLNLDSINRVPTSSVRLIRRLVRDHLFRGSTASQTLAKWRLVRRGEDRNIFPYQEKADMMFNSSLVYEMAVLKGYVEPLLLDIPETDPSYPYARLLLHFTSNFVFLLPDSVPLTSILREFIGGSGFDY